MARRADGFNYFHGTYARKDSSGAQLYGILCFLSPFLPLRPLPLFCHHMVFSNLSLLSLSLSLILVLIQGSRATSWSRARPNKDDTIQHQIPARELEHLANILRDQYIDTHHWVSYVMTSAHQEDDNVNNDVYLLGKAYFDCKEYRKAVHALRDQKGKKAVFLRSYALYLLQYPNISNTIIMGNGVVIGHLVVIIAAIDLSASVLRFILTQCEWVGGGEYFLLGGTRYGLYDRARTEGRCIDLVTFSTLIKIYLVSGNFDGALNVYEEMKALGVKPNLVIYNTLLDAMGRAKRPWQAKSVYREMINNGFVPSWATYASLLRAYGRARYGEDVMNVYKEMMEKGLELNVVLYNTLLAMCADMGYTDEAVQIFEELKKSETCKPDAWTFSSLITIYSCSANQTDDVVRSFDRLQDLGITPDDRFCGCLLNVMTQTPKEELGKLIGCIESANSKLGNLVKHLVEEENNNEVLRQEAGLLFDVISKDVRKAYWNCLIDLCFNLDFFERACVLLDMGLTLEIYTAIQSKSSTQLSLHLKSLSLGAALTALHIWMSDLSKALENGEELPSLLGINTGHGKHKYSDKGIASVFVSHLRELNAPFHETPERLDGFSQQKLLLSHG
ncbi:hypothetical protein GIB67_026351 [Kingdonia uniflora]|uniref:Smr domain-containing protein n=1 Tax=Kingdonia uniflora TaxID=39325 RepID=A0A7J7P6C0_9MAGN|nr:hypothetical protein GIB67_026351 [Kingdonia uniflora]